MRKVTVHQAKTHLSRLLREVEAGEEIIICRGDVEVARLGPLKIETKSVKEPKMRAFEHEAPKTPKELARAYLAGELDAIPKTPEMQHALKLAAFGHLKGKLSAADLEEAEKPVFTDEEWEEILNEDDLNLPPPE